MVIYLYYFNSLLETKESTRKVTVWLQSSIPSLSASIGWASSHTTSHPVSLVPCRPVTSSCHALNISYQEGKYEYHKHTFCVLHLFSQCSWTKIGLIIDLHVNGKWQIATANEKWNVALFQYIFQTVCRYLYRGCKVFN